MDRKMKLKILAVFPLISELIALFFLPSEIPIHYNAAFQVDGYGSKYHVLVIGLFVIVFGLFMNWIYRQSSKTEYETVIYILSSIALLISNVINVLVLYGGMTMGTSISIIGGADGPTTIFLAGSIGDGIPFLLLIGLVVCVGVLKFKKNN